MAFRSIPKRTSLLLALCLCAAALSAAYRQERVYGADTVKAMTLYNKAIDSYERHDPTAALMLLDDAIRSDPSYADAYYNKGTILYQQRQYAQAAKAFKKVSELHPEDNQADYNVGLCYEMDGQTGKAIEAYRKIRSDFPKYPEAQRKIATLKPNSSGFWGHKTEPAREPAAQAGEENTAVTKPAAHEKPLETTQKPYFESLGKPVGHSLKTGKLAIQMVAKDFEGPTGMAVGPNGFLYVADYNKNLIYKLTPDGRKLIFAQGDAIKGPIGMVYDSHSNDLFVANYQSNTVTRINPQGEMAVIASNMHKPYCLYLDSNRNVLFVSEQETKNVSMIQLGPK